MGLEIAFWIMAVVAVVAALAVVTMRNVFRAAISLVFCFVAVAALYITLSADFLAAAQVLVYVGGISVLILLGVMLTRDVPQASQSNRLRVPAFLVAAGLLGLLLFAIGGTTWNQPKALPVTPTTQALASHLFAPGGWLITLEIAGMLLLAAVVGAIVLAREK
jgi:NADH-quinone oxidoreductase subunit J